MIIERLLHTMILYFSGDPRRIQHFVKVHAFSKIIAQEEGLDTHSQFIVESAALIHDIGIKKAEELYGNNTGKLQEMLGPDEAKPMLERLGYEFEAISEICELIARHHTYTGIDSKELQILIEADFLVNLFDDNATEDAIKSTYAKIFQTTAGKRLFRDIYNLSEDDENYISANIEE